MLYAVILSGAKDPCICPYHSVIPTEALSAVERGSGGTAFVLNAVILSVSEGPACAAPQNRKDNHASPINKGLILSEAKDLRVRRHKTKRTIANATFDLALSRAFALTLRRHPDPERSRRGRTPVFALTALSSQPKP